MIRDGPSLVAWLMVLSGQEMGDRAGCHGGRRGAVEALRDRADGEVDGTGTVASERTLAARPICDISGSGTGIDSEGVDHL